ncbi:MAG: hypothetical protein COA37_04035 [Hoeflea sp.]|uniref:Uncharacterized protein DUF1488 n=1 Tax=Hoeflea halophila TaxID=714899 RepID=A0A286IFJ6_9HYPH|nr:MULTISPECIES: DUF1488 domain-containing protein [Hoeflea]PHR24923.1 MAG: hypothetical protein COA37_04035 [Hoeflea sp.]SOE18915.1 uncharacterized protein DUF1488 [Hoeflea halophila]|tara:strand:+ start:6825 stop:7085 length:261 start_codon:yes stop_codon:yes gene_type:complete
MIGFPNQMRSFDEDAGTIRFSGYDGVMEVRFVLEAPALEQIAGLARSPDTAYLEAFDRYRAQIETAAVRAYKKTRKSLIWLSSADF